MDPSNRVIKLAAVVSLYGCCRVNNFEGSVTEVE